MSQNSSNSDNSYSLSLNEIIQSFKDEGLDFDAPIELHTREGRTFILSIYNGSKGQPVIDIGDE